VIANQVRRNVEDVPAVAIPKGINVNRNSDLAQKPITIAGQTRQVWGDAADHYFATFPADCHEHDSLFATLSRCRCTPTVVIDVGANLGLFTLGALTTWPTATLYSYEPHPSAFAALTRNLQPFGLRASATNCALADAERTMHFSPGGPINASRSSGSHLINESHWKAGAPAIEVPVSTLDVQLQSRSFPRVDFIKIDVEGFELDVLQGATNLIARDTPLIYLEFNAWTLMALKNINPRTLLDYVCHNFPHVYRCNPDATLTNIATGQDRLQFLHQNLLAHGCVDNLLLSFRELPAL
jgi:FkbM family methyltransferase